MSTAAPILVKYSSSRYISVDVEVGQGAGSRASVVGSRSDYESQTIYSRN